MATDGLTTTTSRFKPPIVPAAFFGIVLGQAGLGSAWRAAHWVRACCRRCCCFAPWIMEQPFAASYWGFTFGATAPIRMAGHGDAGAIAQLAPYLFAGANNRGRPDHARDVTPDRAAPVCCL